LTSRASVAQTAAPRETGVRRSPDRFEQSRPLAGLMASVFTMAMFDRILHHSIIVKINIVVAYKITLATRFD
jgi:hypothetical protein